ncbi:hypothetical protein K2X85_06310 [bacterium]|nr:hypothetical protein [bacterium]
MRFMGLALWVWGMAALVSAHPISMTQTDVFATRQSLKVSIDLFVEDLFLFHGLEPTDDNFLRKEDILAASEKHKAFLLERFIVRDAQGVPISGKVIDVKMGSLDDKGIPMAELMAHSLVYQIEYPLPPGTTFLTFAQSLGTTQFGFPAVMMLRIKQEGSEVPYVAEMRSNEPHTVHLDWDHPPLSSEASEKEWQEWESTRREKSLGITSYSSVYSFLYIENYEVRHEVLVPLLTLEASVPIKRADPDFLDVAEQESAGPAIKEFFTKANPITIDGVKVAPLIDRVDFYGLDFKDFAQKADQRRVSMVNARVGVILRYPCKSPPERVEVAWDFFNKYVWGAQMVIFTDDKNYTQFFSPYQKTYLWSSPGRSALPTLDHVSQSLRPLPTWSIPFASAAFVVVGIIGAVIGRTRPLRAAAFLSIDLFVAALLWNQFRIEVPSPLATVPRLDSEEARSVFDRLLQNVYRSFDYQNDDQIYDALHRSLAGSILQKTYLAIKQGLVVMEQGGAQARVTKVSLIDGRESPAPGKDPRGFEYHATWQVEGTVEHWGHIHQRVNEYQANFSVEPVGDAWKITAMNVESDRRKSFRTRVRTFQ